MKHLRCAAVQFEHVPDDKEANFRTLESFLEKAKQRDVSVLVFPECCLTGYWHLRKKARQDIEAIAEPVFGGPSSKRLRQMAVENGMTIGAGLVEKAADGKCYNTYVVSMPDGKQYRHRKLHAFISEFVASGSEFTVFDSPYGCKLGILTCYDNNIQENVRITALMGADVIIAPHQTGGCNTKNPDAMGLVDRKLWENRRKDPQAIEAELAGPKGRGWIMRWLPARAHDNGVFYLFSNGVGVDDNEIRTGNAMILDPYGRIIVETCAAGDEMVLADLDFSLFERATGRRWNKSRRPELYGLLAQRTGIEEDTRTLRMKPEGI